MTEITIRHMLKKKLASGETAHYYNPTRAMKAKGFVAESLGTDPLKAAQRAEELNGQWDEAQQGRSPGPLAGTVAAVVKEHQGSDEYKSRSPASNEEVDRCFAIIEAQFGTFQIASIRRRHLKKFYADLRQAGSLHRANAIMKWFRYLFTVAIEEELIVVNPCAKLKIIPTDPRQIIWEDAEVAGVEAAAIAMGRPSVALAVRLAYDLGQRLSDVLRLTWTAYDGKVIRLRQSKAQAKAKKQGKVPKLIVIEILPELRALLDEAMKGAKRSPQIVVSEHTGRPYSRFHFNKVFRDARKGAGIVGKQFLDIRRSSAVRLAEAGCTTEEIVAITGHDIGHGARILETYVPRTAAMGKSAIAKLGEARKRTKSE